MSPFIHVTATAAPPVGGTPTVAWTVTGLASSTQTSYTVNLGSIAAGQYAVIILRLASDSAVETPTGWTLLAAETVSGGTRIFGRLLNGSEGASVTINLVALEAARRAAWVTEAYAGVAVTLTPHVAVNVQATLDAADLTHGFGTGTHLAIAFGSERRTDNTLTAPTGYSNQVNVETGAAQTSTAHCRIATARKSITAASENPAAWGFTGTASGPHAGVLALRGIA